jgi:hypothetical protein
VTAIVLIRTPHNVVDFLIFVVGPLLAFNFLLTALSALSRRASSTGRHLALILKGLGLESPLIVDLLRAMILIYATYMFGSRLGYETFRADILDSRSNPLPAVTVVISDGGAGSAMVLSCGATPSKTVDFIGDAQRLRVIQDYFRTCNSKTVTWRLLYRDDESIYLFASEAPQAFKGGRPLTLILPAKGTYLVLE